MSSEKANQSSPSEQRHRTEERLKTFLSTNMTVRFIIEAIENKGCTIPSNFFRIRSCEGNISGGFSMDPPSASSPNSSPYISICQDKDLELETFQNTVIHELIHAYDKCRVKQLTTDNCKSHACTEIRASTLSGECNWIHEVFRGHPQYKLGHRDCVKRRATKSVSLNPYCEV